MLQAIAENLREQTSAYTYILELSKKEQAAIVASDTEKVDEIVKQVWAELSETYKLEQKRIDLVKRFCAGFGEAYNEQTLMDLIRHVDEKAAKELTALKADLSAVLKQQNAVNELNKELLELHFQYIAFVIDVASSQSQSSNFYGANGAERIEQNASLGILDSQI